ncbi:MAG: MATE family efflux transporter [Lawsonibacter sp.]|jgi:putative MATE family efflux protein|nr:MATE family efflux transporter [Lawsonibacter sp.]MCI9567676.1 MATE family efflux transporter [Lawsonibacter sp.]
MWAFSLYTIIDGIFVARGVGETAMAAVDLSMPFTSLVFAIGVALAAGTSTLISISLGKGDLDRARGLFSQNLAVTAAVSLAITALALIFLEDIALFLGATADTLRYVEEYVGTIAVFAVFFTVSYNMEVQVKANGAPQISTVGVLSCGLMNVALDALFVLVFRWGVWGAALATGLAQVTSAVVFFVYFHTHRERLRLEPFRLDLGAYRRILPLGLSEGLNELSNGLVIFLFNRTILRVIGEQALPTYTIISYVSTLVLMTMTGTAQGMQPLVSWSLGAGRRRDCWRLMRYGAVTAALFALLSFALGELGAPLIVSAFLERDSDIFSYSVSALRAYACSFLVLGCNIIFAGASTAMERPGPAFLISVSRSLVLPAASLLILPALFGDWGIWTAPLVSELACLVLTALCALHWIRQERRSAGGR